MLFALWVVICRFAYLTARSCGSLASRVIGNLIYGIDGRLICGINGRLISGKYLVLSFPWSNAGYLQLFYGENTECLLEGLDAIFQHIGGVPREIWFDNASSMVKNVIKGGGANGSDLLGKWQMGDHDTYLFDGQGRGIILTGVDNYTFTYSAENGKLRIDYDGQNGSDFEYDYTLNGDKMTWTRGGKTYDLTKVAEE